MVLVVKPKRKTARGRPRRRWKDNIVMDLQEMGWGHGLSYSVSELEKVTDACECSNESSGSIKMKEIS